MKKKIKKNWKSKILLLVLNIVIIIIIGGMEFDGRSSAAVSHFSSANEMSKPCIDWFHTKTESENSRALVLLRIWNIKMAISILLWRGLLMANNTNE